MQSRRRKLVKDLKQSGELAGRSTAGALTDLLYDELTDLPTVPLLLGRIRRLLKESHHLGLLSISVLQNERGEQTLGWQGYESLVRSVAAFLLEIKKVALRRDDYVSEVMISGNAFVILLSPPRRGQAGAVRAGSPARRRAGDFRSLRRLHRPRAERLGALRAPGLLGLGAGLHRFAPAAQEGAARRHLEIEDDSEDGGGPPRVPAGRRPLGETGRRVRGADACLPRGLRRAGPAVQGGL